MHFEILVEDASGKIIIDNIMDKIGLNYNGNITYRAIAYSGIGKLPKNLDKESDPSKRVLLNKLPQLIRGYRRVLTENMALFIVIDGDKRDCKVFKQELESVLKTCGTSKSNIVFCIAIEEMESWLLGDNTALLKAYPKARKSIIDSYIQDSLCDTWELMADAVYEDKALGLKRKGYPDIGIQKCEWANRISPHLEIEQNSSQSFRYFIRKVLEIVNTA